MSRLRFSLWPITFLLVTGLALANGGPIARSDLGATGNIRLIKEHDIDLRQETLQVSIDGDWATVRAEYHLVNRGAATTVAYGFPVDYVNPEWCSDCDDVSDEEKSKAGPHLRDVRIEANGKVLGTTEVAEQVPPAGESPPEFLRTWILSELAFSEAEPCIVTVSYRVRNRLDDWSFSSGFKPNYSTRRFRYRLSPSGNWGDGKVERLDISVDIAKLTHLGGQIRKITPAGYVRQGNLLRWQFTAYDLARSADLEIEYDDSARLLSELVVAERLPRALVTQAIASSTLDQPAGSSRHNIAATLDGALDTAWCEGTSGDGVGQTLTFDFAPATIVAAIGIVNGYTKNRGVYLGNGRVRNLTLTTLRQPRNAGPVTKQLSVSLPERDFEQLNRQAPAQFIDWTSEFRDDDDVIRSLAFTIDATTPGGKHPDTCISEIYFIGYTAE